MFGDSRIANVGWQPILMTDLRASMYSGGSFGQPLNTPAYYDGGAGGSTVVDYDYTTALANAPATYPNAVLVDIGYNDFGAGTSSGTFQADYGAMLDAIHAKWPLSPVYVMLPWGTGYDSQAVTMAGWINTVLSTRSAWASVGGDESVWFKPNVATYSTDGIHYNTAAGEAAAAAVWQAALGY